MTSNSAPAGRLWITTWRWGSKYPALYVDRLEASVARHLKQPYRFLVCTPEDGDDYLARMQGCFARLRTFDPDWQARNGMQPGDRIVCLDLDLIITGGLDPLFDRPDPFTILQDVNQSNPCRMNGSVWMLRAGYRPDIWSDFSLAKANSIPFHEFPDDQGIFEHELPDAAAYTHKDGVMAFRKKHWGTGNELPDNARLVAFPGWRDPWKFRHLDWVKEHWR